MFLVLEMQSRDTVVLGGAGEGGGGQHLLKTLLNTVFIEGVALNGRGRAALRIYSSLHSF